MELYQLKCFYEAAREQNITRAAQKLQISQPALSKTIARLEEDLGVRLFDRKSKTVILNEYGQAVLHKTEEIFASMEDIRQNVEDIQKGSVGEIVIGSTLPSSENSWIVDCVRDFILLNDKVSVRQHQMSTERLLEAVVNNDVDIALGGVALMNPELEWTSLYTRKLGLLVSTDSVFAGREEVSVSELAERNLFCNNSNADMESLTYDVCRRAGFEPRITLCSNYSNLIGEMVSRDRGVALMPLRLFDGRPRNGDSYWEKRLCIVPIREEYCSLHGIAAISRSRYVANAARELYRQIVLRAAGEAVTEI